MKKTFILLIALISIVIFPLKADTFDVEIVDASLYDTCELIFAAGDNPPHVIDENAKKTIIKYYYNDFKNSTWDTALRRISNRYGYKVVRGEDKSWLIIKR